MLSVPNVTINGGIFSLVTARPLIKPPSSPTAMQTPSPARITPSELPLAVIVNEPQTPASASNDPTDKSMPPDTITIVMPIAITVMTVVCRTTLAKLPGERKRGSSTATIKHSTIRLMKGKKRLMKSGIVYDRVRRARTSSKTPTPSNKYGV